MPDLLAHAMELADTYASKRARVAAYPFTTEAEEEAAEGERDSARYALESFLKQHAFGVRAYHGEPKGPKDADTSPALKEGGVRSKHE